jgi:hypothetical protein
LQALLTFPRGSSNRAPLCKHFFHRGALRHRPFERRTRRRKDIAGGLLDALGLIVCREQGRLRGRHEAAAGWGYAGRAFQCGRRNRRP